MPSTIWKTFLLLTVLLFLVQFPSTDANKPPDPPSDCAGSKYPSPNSGVLDKPFTKKEMEDALNAGLKQHNYYRALHGASPLTLNSELNARAQHSAECHVKWAAGLTHTGKDGENLATASAWNSEGPVTFNAVEEALRAVDGWYGEYCLASTDPTDQSQGVKGHFTQLVWKSSNQLGLGMARSIPDQSKFQHVFVVGRYLPPGNYRGETDKEVGPLNVADDKMCCRNKVKKEEKLCDTTGGPGGNPNGGGGGITDKTPVEPGSGAETIKPGKVKMWKMVAFTGVQSLVCGVILFMMRT